MAAPFLFRQLFDRETCTYTYLLASGATAVLIDPVLELVERDVKVVKELGLDVQWILNTHVHADHVTGSGLLKKHLPNAKSVISKVSEAKADRRVVNGEKVEFGALSLTCLSTPGHTSGCMSFLLSADAFGVPAVFTGDALLVRGCGRTDFQQGSSETLFKSVNTQLFSLPDATRVFPAHDYKGFTQSTIGEEKEHNPRLKVGTTQEKFAEIMSNLNLSYPKRIDVSLPLNMLCGLHEVVEAEEEEKAGEAAAGGAPAPAPAE